MPYYGLMQMSTQKLALLVVEAREASHSGRGATVRTAAGLSRGELARAIGVNQSSISRWESGKRRPSGDAAIRYARMLRVLADRVAA